MYTTTCEIHGEVSTDDGFCGECVDKYMDTSVNHPPHYKKGIECIDFIESQGLDEDMHLGNAIKYIVRCRHKGNLIEDLEKAIWYLNRRIRKEKGDGKSTV